MKVVVIGANGLVGRHLAAYYLAAGHAVEPLSRSQLDVTSLDATLETTRRLRPHLVVNCAVLGVDQCEEDPDLAYQVNAQGAGNVARAANELRADLVHYSTNYVFDGEMLEGFYTIDHEARPINVYGATKLAGERAVLAKHDRACVIRTSWVFGDGKDGFLNHVGPALAARENISAISDVTASCTYVIDLVRRTAEIVANGVPGIYHVVNAGTCSYAEFAQEAGRIVGITDDEFQRLVRQVKAGDLKLPARRPQHTPMACLSSHWVGLEPLRPWQDALAEYLGPLRCA